MNPIEKTNHVSKDEADPLKEEVVEGFQEELSEDMEVMGPGQILSDARKKLKLTKQNVADKLNFRLTLVDEIENELFDTSVPETFNRGYLRNYAKLVNVSQEDVLISYEQLNVAKTQASELQSFSKGTEKLAENNRIMWISYFILAILIGSTVVWWMQNNTEQNLIETVASQSVDAEKNLQKTSNAVNQIPESTTVISTIEKNELNNTIDLPPMPAVISNEESSAITNPVIQTTNRQTNEEDAAKPEEILLSEVTELIKPDATLTNVTFTFSGDCWVNISDATGERIAWGVKKLGYVMKISGQAPFNVTLGRPELVAINFSDEIIDMSQFNAGNIAKFTLPVTN
jgi:cytoskeleton protein RodZ